MEQLELGPEVEQHSADHLVENFAMAENHHNHGHDYSSGVDSPKNFPAQLKVPNSSTDLGCSKVDPDYLVQPRP